MPDENKPARPPRTQPQITPLPPAGPAPDNTLPEPPAVDETPETAETPADPAATDDVPNGTAIRYIGERAGEAWFRREVGRESGLTRDYAWTSGNHFSRTMTPADAEKLLHDAPESFTDAPDDDSDEDAADDGSNEAAAAETDDAAAAEPAP